MLKSLLPKKELLLSAVPLPDGNLEVSYARTDGRRVYEVGEGVPAKTTTPTRAAVFSLDSYFEHVPDLKAPSLKMLPLVARRYVDAELVFEDEFYRLRAQPTTRHERSISANLAAIPEADLESASAVLPLQNKPCMGLVPMELAIAALIRSGTSEPVIVFWEKGQVLVSLLVEDGAVRVRMSERVSSEDRTAVIARARQGLERSAHQMTGQKDIDCLYTGTLNKFENSGSAALEDKLVHQFRFAKRVNRESLLQSPELFGLPFVDEEWSFLDREYSNQVDARCYARPAAAAAVLGGLVFALWGGFQHLQAISMSRDFDARLGHLNRTISELEFVRPSEEDMAIVRDGLSVQAQSYNEIRLDRMLDWLTHVLPNGVLIRDLEVVPAPVPRQVVNATPVAYAPGEKPFLVTMEMMLAETEFAAAEESSARVVRNLSERLTMVDTRLEVAAPDPGIGRNIALLVNAHARAEDF